MTKPTAEIVEHEGKRLLRVDVNGMGFTIATPVDTDVLAVAVQCLLEQLAGTTASALAIVAMKAVHPELA